MEPSQPIATVEDRIRSHLKKKAGLFVGNPVQSRFFLWQEQVFQAVKIDPVAEIAQARQMIDDVGAIHRFESGHCYKNALALTMGSLFGEKIKYVEGFIVVNERTLVGHAWNVTDGRYFDHTTDLVNGLYVQDGKPIPSRHFFKVVELSMEEVHPHTQSDDKTSIQVLHFLKQNRLCSSDFDVGWSVTPDREHLP